MLSNGLFFTFFNPPAARFPSGLIQHRFPHANDAARHYSGAATTPAFARKSGHFYR